MNRCPVDLFNRGPKSAHVVYLPPMTDEQAIVFSLMQSGMDYHAIAIKLNITKAVAKARCRVIQLKDVLR